MTEWLRVNAELLVEYLVPAVIQVDREDLIEFLKIGHLTREEQDSRINEETLTAYIENDDSCEWMRDFPDVDPMKHEVYDSGLHSAELVKEEPSGSDTPG